ncbi:MAG TPA: hypothetical protein VIL25_06025 [Vicinamibacterales bacterium]
MSRRHSISRELRRDGDGTRPKDINVVEWLREPEHVARRLEVYNLIRIYDRINHRENCWWKRLWRALRGQRARLDLFETVRYAFYLEQAEKPQEPGAESTA